MLLGNEWCLKIFPGGDAIASEGMVTLDLWNKSNRAIEVDYAISVNDGSGKQVVYQRSPTPDRFEPVGTVNPEGFATSARGFKNFALRLSLLSFLDNGILVIVVHMKLATPTISAPPPFIPENPVAKMIQGLFLEEKSTDIVFEVAEGKGKNNAMKVTKTAPVTFLAHRLIIENCSSIFAV
jgi:hypothetical protein